MGMPSPAQNAEGELTIPSETAPAEVAKALSQLFLTGSVGFLFIWVPLFLAVQNSSIGDLVTE